MAGGIVVLLVVRYVDRPPRDTSFKALPVMGSALAVVGAAMAAIGLITDSSDLTSYGFAGLAGGILIAIVGLIGSRRGDDGLPENRN